MATKIRIGHASTSNPSSGLASDEVLISSYYTSLKPTVVLRPATAELAEKSAAACEAGCTNNKIEYSQSSRGTLYTEAKKVNYNLAGITTTCYADCSSFMTVCALAGGANLEFSYIPTCGDMRSIFTKSGAYNALTSKKYLNSSDYLQRGDILVRENYINGSRHTVMVLDNGSMVPASPALQLSDLVIVKIAVDITSIDYTKVTAVAKITKIENGLEEPLADLDLYQWAYSLAPLSNSAQKASSKKLEVKASNTKFTLNSLTPGSSYCLKISATELNSDTCFSSPNIIFTTASKEQYDDTSYKFKIDTIPNRVDKIHLKTKDGFKQAIIYINT